MIELSAEARELCNTAGKCHCVSAAIHPADRVFWFLHDHPIFGSKADAINNHFSDGADSTGKLRADRGATTTRRDARSRICGGLPAGDASFSERACVVLDPSLLEPVFTANNHFLEENIRYLPGAY